MTSPAWDPGQYERYTDQRLRPALELLARVHLEAPERVFDLGCGTGRVTRLLAERWPTARVVGLDNSAAMLEQARGESSRVEWVEADAASWRPDEPADLIYSNATLHWLDDHAGLFPRLLEHLRPGGVLAVQMPLSWDLPSHRLLRETLAQGPHGSDALRTRLARRWVDDAPVYYDLLAPGAASIDVWETEYLQQLQGDDPVLEWVSGTTLRPVFEELEGEARQAFLADYCARLRAQYPRRADGTTLFPFRRLFLVATR